MITTKHFLLFAFVFLFTSTTSEAQWEEVPGFGGERVQEMYQNDQWIFVLQNNGLLYRSNDLGANWELLNDEFFADAQSLAVSEDLLFIQADNYFFKSTDQGDSWTQLPPYLTNPGGARKLAIANGEVFSGRFGKLNKIDLATGAGTQVLTSNDNDLSIYLNGTQIWISFAQKGTQMSADNGQTWVEYPQFYNVDIAFAQGKAFGARNAQPHSEMQYYEIGNPTPTTVELPLSPASGPPNALFALDGDIIAAWGNQIAYRYIISSDTWEVYESPSEDFELLGGFKQNNTTLLFFDEGVMTSLDGSPHWYNRSQGLRHKQKITLRIKEGMLHCSNLKNSFFRTSDNPNWNTGPMYTPGEFTPKIHRIVKHEGAYYSDDFYRILRSTDLITWEEIGTKPGNISGDLIVSGDFMWVMAKETSTGPIKLFYSTSYGTNWTASSWIPYGNKENFGHYVHQFGQTIHSHNDSRKLYQLDKVKNEMTQIATIPGSTGSEASSLSISGQEMVYRDYFSGLRYSSDGGLNWVDFVSKKEDGSDLYPQHIIVSPGGLVIQNSRELFKSKGPGFPFVKIPMPYLDALPSNSNININSFVAFQDSLYIGLSNGLIYRTPLADLEPKEFSGRVYLDKDKNGIFDGDDFPISGLLVNKGPYKIAATDSTGYYRINDLPLMDSIMVNIPWPDWKSTPLTHQTATPDTIYDFALTPPFDNNFCLTGTARNIFRPGFSNRYYLDISNFGIGTDAILKFLPDTALVDISGFSIAPNYYLGDTMVWELRDFELLETRKITLDFTVSLDALFSPSAKMYGEVQSPQGDTDFSNNVFCTDYLIRGAYDPNDKQVDKEQPLKGENLTYTIRFQNTGNFPASFITIRDTLSEYLDLRSTQILATSHSVQLEVVDTNILHFVFDPIFLPDSISNEPESHGYLTFCIDPKPGLDYGTVINNSCGIYFDFNPPIITNTVTSVISKPTSLDSIFLSFCEGEIFNGITLFADTLLIDTLELADEIRYTARFLTVNKSTTSDTTVAVCENEIYLWNGESYHLPGIYSLVIPNSRGCDSTLTLQLEHLAIAPPTTTLLSIEEGEEILGIPIYSDTTLVDTLQNMVGCDSIVFWEIMVISSTEDDFARSGIEIYPIPAQDHLFINWYDADIAIESIALFSSSGKAVDFQSNTDQSKQIHLRTDHLTSGVYYCHLKIKDKVLIKKIILY